MSCTSPLKAYYKKRLDGKNDILFVDSNELLPYERDGQIYFDRIDIPCGQCIGCRLEYSRQWAIRCMLEADYYDRNYFVTFTYDDAHLPAPAMKLDQETGEVLGWYSRSSLEKSAVSKFMKDLRSYLKYHYNYEGVRFYACGEYGDKTKRPHYHLILFNCPDMQIYEFSDFRKRNNLPEGYALYNSKIVDKIWKNGYAVFAEVNFDTCAYVARYVMKKKKGKASSFYEENGIIPEFTVCSRRPGIAYKHYQDNRDRIYEFDEIPLTKADGRAMRVRPPRYFDRLYDFDDPESLALLKENRKRNGEIARENRLRQTSLSERELLRQEDANTRARLKLLKREL